MKLYKFSLSAIAMLAFSAAQASAAIIISQYYEGASNNKYIELYNTGTTDVDLAAGEYKISTYSNANREGWKTDVAANGGTLALDGVITAGSTYLIAHNLAAAPAYAVAGADKVTSGGAGVNFNGDDSTVLWTGTTYSFASVVDAFGATANSFADLSYVRNADILTGTNGDFDSADWTLYSLADVADATSDVTQYLGFHVADAVVPEPTSFALMFASIGAMAFRRT